MSTLALRLTGLCRAGMARCIFKAVTTELIPTLQLFLYLAGKWDPTFMAQWRSACAEVNGLASADGDDDAEGKRLFSIHFAASTDVDQIGTMNERFDTFGGALVMTVHSRDERSKFIVDWCTYLLDQGVDINAGDEYNNNNC